MMIFLSSMPSRVHPVIGMAESSETSAKDSGTESKGAETGAGQSGPLPLVVIDMGRVRSQKIEDLKDGVGPLIDEVDETLGRVQNHYADELKGKEILPVVLIYKRKARRSRFRLFS
jgi:hypothetical protein